MNFKPLIVLGGGGRKGKDLDRLQISAHLDDKNLRKNIC